LFTSIVWNNHLCLVDSPLIIQTLIPLIYPLERKIAFLYISLKFDTNGELSARLYDKRYDFSFDIAYCLQLDRNMPTTPVHGVYISQLYITLELSVCIVYSPSLWYLATNSRFLKESFHHIFQNVFSEDINTLLKSIMSLAYKWYKMVLAIRFCFKVDCCFPNIPFDDIYMIV
jgi:hypothetical protein